MTRPTRCDVCAKAGAREFTPDDRGRLPSVAPWVRFCCEECRERFARGAEREARHQARKVKAA